MKKIHYAWIVLFLAFLTLLTAQGIRLSFGAFITPWEESFSTDRSVISMIAMISYIIYGISQPYVGSLVDKYGVRIILSVSTVIIGVSTMLTFFAKSPWQLILIYGVIASVGFGGASQVAGSVAVTNWFKEKRGIAIGLMTAGTAAGQLALVPLALFLINRFGWENTVLILGAFLVVVIFPIILIFLRNSPSEKGITAYGSEEVFEKESSTKQATNTNVPKEKLSIFQLLKTRRFLFLMLPFFVCGVTTSGLIDTHLIPFAQYCGYSAAITGTAVSLLAAFNIFGTIYSGHLADRWSSKNILTILYAGRALSIMILLVIIFEPTFFGFFVSQSHLLIIFAISFGIVDFATVAPTVRLATEYFKNLSVGSVIGWLFLSHQIGSALGSYLPGLLYDLTGGYTTSFVYSILLCVVAAVLSFSLPETFVKQKKQPVTQHA